MPLGPLVRSATGIALLAVSGCGPSSAEPDEQTPVDTLVAMTFNIFHDAATGPGRGSIAPWEARRDLVAGTIDASDADLVGLQEALPWQVEWLRDQLPRYEHFGRGGDADGSGWSVSILFDPARLSLQESGHFWLSSTPDVPGSAGGNDWGWTGPPRIVSWALLAFTRSGRRLYVYNAHLPPPEAGAPSRTRSVVLLAERIAARSEPDVPFLLLGDLNATEDEFSMRYLAGEASACEVMTCSDPPATSPIAAIDTWRVVNSGEEGTRCGNGSDGLRTDGFGDRVDYVLVEAVSADEEATQPPQVLSSSIFTFGSSCASDHLPVLSQLIPPGSAP